MRLWIDSDFQPDDLIALRCARRHPDVELVGVSRMGEGIDAGALSTAEALLAIGPLTNVAPLVGPAALPSRVVVMGGALAPVDYRGRVRVVEHNFCADPGAAATLLDAIRVVLVPLDVTANVLVPASTEPALLAEDAELAIAVDVWREALRRDGADDSQLAIGLHDPLALLVALDEVDVGVESMPLTVAEDGSLRVDAAAREHDVIRAIDAEGAIARIVTSFSDERR